MATFFNDKKGKQRLLFVMLAFIIIVPGFLLTAHFVFGQDESNDTSVEELNDGIKAIKDKIKSLEDEKDQYEKEIEVLRDERVSLNREVNVLDNRIAQKEIEIETEQARIDQTTLEIQVVDDAVVETEENITAKKLQLSSVLDRLDREGEADYFQIFLLNDSFTEFFDAIKSLENIQGDVHQLVTDLKVEKAELEEQQKELEEKRDFQEQLKLSLEEKKASLEDQRNTKDFLIAQTRYSERQFQGLIAEIKKEQEAANNEIVGLEREIRDRLVQEELLSTLGGDEEFIWPVNSRLITARFHDPSYPYRYIFEHPAIDIAVPQGSPIKATKSGYVGRAKDAGLGYSYIMIIHDDGMSSVYGHVSSILVNEDDFVVQGQTVGRSGGAPGTPGAGRLSTGSHLHFELRQDGVPVDPLNYL